MENARANFEALSGARLEYFLLARLERVASRLSDPRAREVPGWQNLARHALVVAYADCEAFGLAEEACVILREAHDTRYEVP